MNKYDWKSVRPEVAQRLMAAVDDYVRKYTLAWSVPETTELMSCLEMARAEAAPKLRTKAEVDAEIAAVVRGYHSRLRESRILKGPLEFNSFRNVELGDLNRLCDEQLATEIDLQEARDNALHVQQEADRGLCEDRDAEADYTFHPNGTCPVTMKNCHHGCIGCDCKLITGDSR